MTQYGLSSCKRPAPVDDNLGLTFWVVAGQNYFIVSNGLVACENIQFFWLLFHTLEKKMDAFTGGFHRRLVVLGS